VETLELLEELLAAYPGTLLLVSHDREFLDNVVTSTLALEGNGRVGEYVGGYTDWVRQSTRARSKAASVAAASAAPAPDAAPASLKRKLNYKDSRELDELPKRIEALEARIAECGAKMQEPAFYQQDGAAIIAANSEVAVLQTELDAAYQRWQELDAG
ncbi:MAG: ABC transporter ATP-binding protein, partial [Dokdonella sp.]